MTAKNKENWEKRLRGRDPSEYLEPEKVPDWDTLPYPDLDTVKTYGSHPKPYTWHHYDRDHTYAHDYQMIRPDVYIKALRLFRARDGGRPWHGHIPRSSMPLGPRRIPIEHLGSAIKHLPRYIPPDAPVISHWSNEYHDAPDAHGVVMHCHWCDRPFVSLGYVKNADTRNHPAIGDDIEGRVRHPHCHEACHFLTMAYCGQWWNRVGKITSARRDMFQKRNYPTRRSVGRTAHKYALHKGYKIRWDFLDRYISPQGLSLPMNDIVPRNKATPPVTKTQRNKLRQQIYRDSEDMVRMAKAVLAGDHEWNSGQVQVFKALMNKVIPDAHVAEEHTEEAKSLDNLSTEDLERLIAETEGVTPSVIDNEPDEPSIKIIQPSEEDEPLSTL